MTKATHAPVVSSVSTFSSSLPETLRRSLAGVPETRGTGMILLEPMTFAVPLPDGFEDIDEFVERAEQDPVTKQAIAAGRRAVSQYFHSKVPRTLVHYRLRKGWSQNELAAQLGRSKLYVARLEAGVIDPQVSTLTRLAAVLGIPPTDALEAITSGPAGCKP